MARGVFKWSVSLPSIQTIRVQIPVKNFNDQKLLENKPKEAGLAQ